LEQRTGIRHVAIDNGPCIFIVRSKTINHEGEKEINQQQVQQTTRGCINNNKEMTQQLQDNENDMEGNDMDYY
jgi:hypothetical protein